MLYVNFISEVLLISAWSCIFVTMPTIIEFLYANKIITNSNYQVVLNKREISSLSLIPIE